MLWFIGILMVAGFFLLFLEVFLPGGILGVLGGLMLVGGVVMCFFYFDPSYAMGILLGTLIISVGLMIVSVKIFPHSPIGKRIILRMGEKSADGFSAEDGSLAQLVGLSGVTVSTLRPSGIADIGDKRIDVVTDGEYIDPGQRVTVVLVDGNRVVVERSSVS